MKSHDIEYEISGSDIQVVDIILDPGETVLAEAGAMLAMDGDIEMKSSFLEGSSSAIKGLINVGKRLATGESIVFTHFTNTGSKKAKVTFATPYLGKVVPIPLNEVGGSFLCSKGSFLCAAKGVDVSIGFEKNIKAGLFGRNGFILQKLEGDGLAFLHSGGNLYRRILERDETIYVDSKSLLGFNKEAKYDLTFVKGIKNMFFSGEGMFLYKISGPAVVFAQSFNFNSWLEESKNNIEEALKKSRYNKDQ